MSWYRVRMSKLLVAGIALWYALVPMTDVSSVVGYVARIAIVLFGIWLLGKRGVSRFLEGRMPVKATFATVLLATLAIISAGASGELGKLIDFVAFFGGIAGYFLIAERYPLQARDIFLFTVTVLVAGILLEITGAPGTRGEFGLLPFTGENWKVLIKGPHFTGWGGVFLLFSSLLFSNQKGWKLKHLLLLLLAWYLIVLSGSRSSIAAALATVVLWFSGTARRLILRRPYIGVLVTLLAGLSMYLAPVLIFQGLSAEGFLGTLLKISPGQEDVTAGRFLTWLYHFELFFDHFWTGAPSQMVTESGEAMSRELMASNESFFTKVLAKFGIIGLFFQGAFLFLSWFALKNRSYEGYIISIIFVVTTAASGVFGSTYYVYSVVGYWGYFSLLASPPSGARR
ncbi:O-antigen ligase family protein [Salinibacter sp.]|uniref:O-antigen ligase family protein n=1 Tax=Salinibacter sp. TaxID=2065818 RepID=UPI0021E78419|nr:O-antigen ligase family protein [Salinibacter sp.]